MRQPHRVSLPIPNAATAMEPITATAIVGPLMSHFLSRNPNRAPPIAPPMLPQLSVLAATGCEKPLSATICTANFRM